MEESSSEFIQIANRIQFLVAVKTEVPVLLLAAGWKPLSAPKSHSQVLAPPFQTEFSGIHSFSYFEYLWFPILQPTEETTFLWKVHVMRLGPSA